MGLEYNVLVIDDNSIFFKGCKESIEDHLEENGFLVKVINVSNETEFDEIEEHLKEFDLILVDLMFGPKVQGNEFIKRIRANIFTDLLFYSSDVDKLNNLKSDFSNQNIIFAERDDQNDEVEEYLTKLLDNMIRKCNQPRATRGIVMECVAELDERIKKIISLLLDDYNKKHSDNTNKRIDNVILQYSKEAIDQTIKFTRDYFGVDIAKTLKKTELDKMPNTLEIDVLLYIEEIRLSNSFRNHKILKHIYKDLYGENDTYNSICAFEGLLKTRNILAHTTQHINDDSIPFFISDGHEYVLTTEECLRVRNSITELYSSFDYIIEQIKALE